MTRMARFILALIVGLALLAWAVSGVVQTTAQEWFERDVRSRAQLVLTGERQSLADTWNDPANLDSQLETLAHGDRVMGAAACDADLSTRSSTPGFPEEFGCSKVGSRFRASDSIAGKEGSGTHEWSTVASLPTGRVYVSALPISFQGRVLWIAHGSGDADQVTVDRNDHVRVPPEEESYHIRRVWLSEEEQQGFYYGFSNEGLWPLCHVAHTRPIFRAEDWREYCIVNQKFADAVCSEVDSTDPIIMVQDYHFALVPAMIRKRLPAATIIAFWHIPWPNSERMGICPWRNELLEGLLGSSILGFHTQLHCNNYLDSVDRYLETRRDREQNAVVMRGRRTLIRPYPIALEWPVRWVATAPSPEECRERVWRDLGLKPNALLGVGVDRLDYTKGVEERLLAVEQLLERYPEFRGRFSFAQLAAPSRTKIERYRELNETVGDLAERINVRFGNTDYKPIILLRSHHEPPEVFRFYRAADLCYVSSLHDGMNLVAKEFVAARTDLKGILVLSEFTGAARELTEALIVNPYDLEASSNALTAALTMPVEDQQDRMRSMRSLLMQFNVYRWAGKMLVDAARLRNQERVAGRLAEHARMGTATGR